MRTPYSLAFCPNTVRWSMATVAPQFCYLHPFHQQGNFYGYDIYRHVVGGKETAETTGDRPIPLSHEQFAALGTVGGITSDTSYDTHTTSSGTTGATEVTGATSISMDRPSEWSSTGTAASHLDFPATPSKAPGAGSPQSMSTPTTLRPNAPEYVSSSPRTAPCASDHGTQTSVSQSTYRSFLQSPFFGISTDCGGPIVAPGDNYILVLESGHELTLAATESSLPTMNIDGTAHAILEMDGNGRVIKKGPGIKISEKKSTPSARSESKATQVSGVASSEGKKKKNHKKKRASSYKRTDSTSVDDSGVDEMAQLEKEIAKQTQHMKAAQKAVDEASGRLRRIKQLQNA